ncbi:MAG: DUF5320 domain-containing protein [Pirellulaceae bacterium]|nr:DUF5320 domain-containing protein [Pirellulaceae bacterium]
MPGGDRTGPAGMGPMTGRGAGFCAGANVPGFLNRGFGGFGRGRGGGGRGWRNRHYATGLTGWQRAGMGAAAPQAATPTISVEAEKQFVEAQVAMMQSQLDELKNRLAELEAQK